MSRLSPRTLLTVLMDVLIVLAVAQTMGIIVSFFGRLASHEIGGIVISLTDRITIPFGIAAIKTPYGGVFDVDAALTVVAFLLVEWALSIWRGRA